MQSSHAEGLTLREALKTYKGYTSAGRLHMFWIASPALPVRNDEQMIFSESKI